MSLQLGTRQKSIVDLINERPEIDEIVLIGPTGCGKSALAAHVFISICDAFPYSQIFVWRKNFSTARKTIWRTYKKMLADMNMVEEQHYHLNEGSLLIEFPNKSIITFAEADASKDRDQNKIKGLDITANQIEESNEMIEDAVDMVMSRKGRANQQGQPSINILTMNPNNGWTKSRYYDKWKKGELPSNVMVIEFTLEDSWQSQGDIDSLLRSKPKWWIERYLKNNWNYLDEDHALISGYLWEKAKVYHLPQPNRDSNGNIIPKDPRYRFDKVIGVDVSDNGGDACVASIIEEGVLTAQKELKIPERTYGQNSDIDSRPTGYLFAQQLIAFAESKGFTKQFAQQISLEVNGVGTSCLLPNELVMTTCGARPIVDIGEDEVLIGKHGQPNAIVNKQRYAAIGQKVYTIHLIGSPHTTTFTGEHPIWAAKQLASKRTTIGEFGFVKTKNLVIGHWLDIPNVYMRELPTPDLSKYNLQKTRSYTKNIVDMNEVAKDPDFWWFVGYWLGDGWLQSLKRTDRKNDRKDVHLCFNLEQKYYLHKAQVVARRLFNRSGTFYAKARVDNIVIRSNNLHAFLLDNFGQKAAGKYISEWVKYLPKELKAELVKGYLDADGHIGVVTEKRNGVRSNSIAVSSVSLELINGISDILFSLGIVNSVRLVRKAGTMEINGKAYNTQDAYSVCVGGYYSNKLLKIIQEPDNPKNNVEIIDLKQGLVRAGCFIQGDRIYRKIKNITVENYSGYVYNFETVDNTFMTPGILTHNCRDGMKVLGWYIDEYTATGKSRNETMLNMRRALDEGEIQVLQREDHRGHDDELWREISAHDTDMVDGVEKVTKKDKIKEVLGRSPDYADSFSIAVRAHSKLHGKLNDPSHNMNRIGW
jgi:hypothetical protein